MGLFDYFDRRRARESVSPAGTEASPEQSDEAEEIPSAPLAVRASGRRRGGDDAEIPGVGDLRDLSVLIEGALRGGNATVSTEGGVIDLRAAGLRNGMLEALDLPAGHDAEPEEGERTDAEG